MTSTRTDSPEVEAHRILCILQCIRTKPEDLSDRILSLRHTAGYQFTSGYPIVRHDVAPFAELLRCVELGHKVVPQFSDELQDGTGTHSGDGHRIDSPDSIAVFLDIKVHSILLADRLVALHQT